MNSNQLTEDKIAELGRVITSQSQLIHDAYFSDEHLVYDGTRSKMFKQAKQFGLFYEHADGLMINIELRKILHKVANRHRHVQIIPDIEQWKLRIEELSRYVQNAQTDFRFDDETNYLHEITQQTMELKEALRNKIISIEYTINIGLNNTYSLKQKRIMLESLKKEITALANKIEGLSRAHLQDCHLNIYKVSYILDSLSKVVEECRQEFEGYLSLTLKLIDKLQNEARIYNQRLLALNRHIKNNLFDPKEINPDFNELSKWGLVYGGMQAEQDYSQHLCNTFFEDNDFFLARILEQLNPDSEPAITKRDLKFEEAVLVTNDEVAVKEESRFTKIIHDYFRHNNTDASLSKDAITYWRDNHLHHILTLKSFIALILHHFNCNFTDDLVIHTQDGYCWKLYLDKRVGEYSDTVNIHNLHYLRYLIADGEPSVF